MAQTRRRGEEMLRALFRLLSIRSAIRAIMRGQIPQRIARKSAYKQIQRIR